MHHAPRVSFKCKKMSEMIHNMHRDPATEITKLREFCAKHSIGTVVTPVIDGGPEWVVQKDQLRNVRADYFSIGLYTQENGDLRWLIEQKETALVMLLMASLDGRDAVLLSFRTEPGLIGLTNLSTTIQSTPSNYFRKHGGKSTPFIEIAADPASYGTVMYDGEHHDWGDFYLEKTKRFLIVQLKSPIEAPRGFYWVSFETAQALLLADYLLTSDLRVSIPLLRTARQIKGATAAATVPSDIRPALQKSAYSPGTVDGRGATVSFFNTQTETREISSWIQPLLVPGNRLEIRLPFMRTGSGRYFAIEKRTQTGLSGRELWFPARMESGRIVRTVSSSAEGGRFWQFRNDITLIEVDCPRNSAGAPLPVNGGTWMTEKELSSLVALPLQTSLELRMAWSLVYGGGLAPDE